MKAVRWEDTKRRIRELDPDWDSADRVAARERSWEELRDEQRGHQLAQPGGGPTSGGHLRAADPRRCR